VTSEYSVAWKRQAFLKFVEVFRDTEYSSELKAKIIQYILIPCMANCFENGLGDEFVGSPPMPDSESPDNIVNVLLNEVDGDGFGVIASLYLLLFQTNSLCFTFTITITFNTCCVGY